MTGLEPVRHRWRWILSPLRLPIPSHRQIGRVFGKMWEIGGHFGGQEAKIRSSDFKKPRKNQGFLAARRQLAHRILSPLRLPIPSQRKAQWHYNTVCGKMQGFSLHVQAEHFFAGPGGAFLCGHGCSGGGLCRAVRRSGNRIAKGPVRDKAALPRQSRSSQAPCRRVRAKLRRGGGSGADRRAQAVAPSFVRMYSRTWSGWMPRAPANSS